MRYKYRTMENDSLTSKQGKQHAKMQSVSKRRDFILYVQQYATDKMYSLIRKGIDPNFQCTNTGGKRKLPLGIISWFLQYQY